VAGFGNIRFILPLVFGCALAASAQLVDRTKELNRPNPSAADLTIEKRADIFMARKMYREAQEAYKTAIEIDPKSPRLFNKLGIAYHQQMDFSGARRYYVRASRIDKKYSQAINNLGAIYHAEGRYKKAAQTYKKALKITPYSASVYSNLGTSHFVRGRFKDASKAYLTALQLDPDVFEHRNTNGTLLQERSVNNRGKYYYFMAKAYALAGLYDRALLHVRKALEEGYSRRKKIAAEAAFEPMLEMPAFQRVIFPEMFAASAANPVN
jgi:tetratricopeptide (TPR) repeat protein